MLRHLAALVVCGCALNACGASSASADLAKKALDQLYTCDHRADVLGSLGTLPAQSLLFLAPGPDGDIHRYQVRIVGPYGSNINIVDLYKTDKSWVRAP